MQAEERTVELRQYLQILKRRGWIMAGVFVTVVVTAVLASMRMTPIYEAQTRVEIQPVSTSLSDAAAIELLIDPRRSLATQVQLIQSDSVLEGAAQALGLPSAAGLKGSLGVELVQDTQIVTIRVRHPLPETAQKWANGVAQAYIDFRRDRAIDAVVLASEEISGRIEEIKGRIQELDKQIAAAPAREVGAKAERDTLIARMGALEAQLQALPDAEALRRGGGTIIAPARTPTSPVGPNIRRNVMLAVALGAALAVGVAFLAESLDERVRSPEEVEQRVGAPIVGYVPLVKEWAEGELLATVDDPKSGGAEAYRTIRTNLRFLGTEHPIPVLLVTSAVAEEGKSTTAANLAVVLAQGGTKTVLVSGDLRRPSVEKFFGRFDSRGLLNALDRDSPLQDALQPTGIPNFRLLPTGGFPPNPTEILASPRFGDVLRMISEAADLVLVDSPPVLGLADASILASRVDGVLLVVDAHRVARRSLSHAADQIRKAGGRIVGIVMNAVEPREGYGYYYQYYYYRYAQDGRSEQMVEALQGTSSSDEQQLHH
jgi:capsular exopolysaccharide synthesis family protein